MTAQRKDGQVSGPNLLIIRTFRYFISFP